MNRLLLGTSALALALTSAAPGQAAGAAATPPPTPQIACGPGSLPETGIQGRVSKADVDSGRAAKGYRCNSVQIGHFGATGGFQVHRFQDKHGHDCGYFDSTLLFPKDTATNAVEGLGVYVMDMSDPAHPKHTATLSTPAMLSPHESLRVNQKRGLIAADMGYPSTNPGFVDVYDLNADCLHPTLDSSTPLGVLGHESAFALDGKTFYVSSTGGHTLTAVDLTDPKVPTVVWFSVAYAAHGMSMSDDGNRLYMADTGSNGPAGLTVLDTSQVQARVVNPTVPEVSKTTWPDVSIPQNALPVTIKGRKYVVEVDEYTSSTTTAPTGIPTSTSLYNAGAKVGAGRIIDITDEKAPKVVSNLRLAVHQPAARAGDQQLDPGAASPVQGYAGHYCAVPKETDPTIVACSYIVSGLRVFDIRNPLAPKEIAYFNGPVVPGTPMVKDGAFAMSAPAFVPSRNEIWYTDGNSGLYVVRLTGAAAKIFGGTTPGAAAAPVARPVAPTVAVPGSAPGAVAAPTRTSAGRALASTGLPVGLPLLAVGLAGVALLLRRRSGPRRG